MSLRILVECQSAQAIGAVLQQAFKQSHDDLLFVITRQPNATAWWITVLCHDVVSSYGLGNDLSTATGGRAWEITDIDGELSVTLTEGRTRTHFTRDLERRISKKLKTTITLPDPEDGEIPLSTSITVDRNSNWPAVFKRLDAPDWEKAVEQFSEEPPANWRAFLKKSSSEERKLAMTLSDETTSLHAAALVTEYKRLGWAGHVEAAKRVTWLADRTEAISQAREAIASPEKRPRRR